MFAIRLLNPSHNGEVTHAHSEVGRWTIDGTFDVVAQAMVVGVLGGAVYLAVRSSLGRRPGLIYGFLLLAVFGPVVLDGSYEYFRFVSTWAAVAMFAALYPLYGLVVAVVADRLAPPPTGVNRSPLRRRLVRAAVVSITVAGALGSAGQLRADYLS
jgi:hypothetical protein